MHLKDKYCIISATRLIEFLESQWKLQALEFAGVDNWEGYGINFEDYIKDYCEKFGCSYEEDMSFLDIAEHWVETRADFMEDY